MSSGLFRFRTLNEGCICSPDLRDDSHELQDHSRELQDDSYELRNNSPDLRDNSPNLRNSTDFCACLRGHDMLHASATSACLSVALNDILQFLPPLQLHLCTV